MRGLESYEPIALTRKKRLRRKATRIVFEMEDTGGDATTIANYYIAVTKHCAVIAHHVALQDAREVAVEDMTDDADESISIHRYY